MQRGGRRQADLDRVEILQDAAVFGDVVLLRPEGELGVGELAVEQVAAMAFIDDDEVILVDRRHVGRSRRKQGPFHQALDGADMHLGFGFGRGGLQPFEIEDVGEGAGTDHLRRLELSGRLAAERVAIDDEADAPKALRGKQAVKECDGELRLAGAGRHRDKHFPLLGAECFLDLLDGRALIGA